MENLNAEQIKYCLELILKSGIGMSRDDVDVTDIKRALALINSQEQRIKELTEENERLKNSITFQVVMPDEKKEEIKAECLEKIELDVKAINSDTVSELQTRFAIHYGTYTDKDMTPIAEVFRLLDQITKEMLEGDNEN